MKPLLLSLLALAASGCAVYAPTVPSTPIIEAGQAEVSAVLRGGVALELNGAYAPAPHVLVTVESALLYANSETTRNNGTEKFVDTHRQAGVGLGTFTVLDGPKHTYLAAVAGMGFAAVNVHDYELFNGFFYYQARYNRYYGQVYMAQQHSNITTGFSVRGTWVDYRELLEGGVPLSANPAHFYLEPTIFMRIGTGALQGQGTLGLSLPGNVDRSQPNPGALSPTSGLISIGLILHPHLLKSNAASPTAE